MADPVILMALRIGPKCCTSKSNGLDRPWPHQSTVADTGIEELITLKVNLITQLEIVTCTPYKYWGIIQGHLFYKSSCSVIIVRTRTLLTIFCVAWCKLLPPPNTIRVKKCFQIEVSCSSFFYGQYPWYSEISAHVCSEIRSLITLRHLSRLRAVASLKFISESVPPSHMRKMFWVTI